MSTSAPTASTRSAASPADPALPERLRHFLAGSPELDAAGSGETIEVEAPFTGRNLVSFSGSTSADVLAKIDRARAAQRAWAKLGVRGRSRILLDLHALLRGNVELLLDIVQAENGKARLHAFDEVMDAFNALRHVGLSAPSALAAQSVRGAIPGLTTTKVVRDPVGVVGFISPWNYPLSLGANDVFATLAAGNAVVHKVDSKTPLTAILMRRLAVSAGVPADVWQLVPGTVEEVGTALIENVDGLSFTGSTAAGRGIAQQAAARLIPAAMELGGKNPMIIAPSADLDAAVRGAVRAAFSSTGQLCISVERIYVVDDGKRYRDFVDRFARATRGLRLGGAYTYSAEVGSLSHSQQLERVSGHVEQARASGAVVEAGGRARPDLGPYFYEPTVLTGVTPEAALFEQETFGPVAAVYPVASVDEAVERANDTEYGLNASVFAGTKREGFDIAARVQAGMVNINEAFAAAWGSIAAPSGGIKSSGLGHRHGHEGLLTFTNTRTLSHQALTLIAPPEAGAGAPGPLGSGLLGKLPHVRVSSEQFQKAMTVSLEALRALRMK